MRQLKRSFTVVERDGSQQHALGSPRGSATSSAARSPVQRTPERASKLVFAGAAKDTTPTDAPFQPPRKRPTACLQPCRSPCSPPRLLTPRVSWSDIISHSHEPHDCEARHPQQSPSTPLLRVRQPPSPPKKLSWRRRPPSEDQGPGLDQNEGRFEREFCGVTAIGKGQFSIVYRAQNRIDQCHYAVKKTTKISQGLRRTQLREVFALANVSMEAEGCPNIVRYYSSWVEDGRLHIQTELCQGSLRDSLAQRCRLESEKRNFAEAELVRVLRHVANGLRMLHQCGFVHLDIKPDNILVGRNPAEKCSGCCYKIADLGLAVAAMGSGCDDISEGDCRYLAKEVLRGDLSDLPKADVFSLGLVCYELATNPKPLPCNGEEWHRLREGHFEIDSFAPLSQPLVVLLRRMVHATPAERPPCEEITLHPLVAPDDELQALHEKMRQRTLEAERNRQLADAYWHEMMLMKKQELLQGRGVSSSQPAIATGGAVLRRGRTS